MNADKQKELERYVTGQFDWEKLPQHIKPLLENNPKKWKVFVISYSLQHQLPYKTSLVRTMADERTYYNELVQRSRESFMV